jgi:hypothetical protein
MDVDNLDIEEKAVEFYICDLKGLRVEHVC